MRCWRCCGCDCARWTGYPCRMKDPPWRCCGDTSGRVGATEQATRRRRGRRVDWLSVSSSRRSMRSMKTVLRSVGRCETLLECTRSERAAVNARRPVVTWVEGWVALATRCYTMRRTVTASASNVRSDRTGVGQDCSSRYIADGYSYLYAYACRGREVEDQRLLVPARVSPRLGSKVAPGRVARVARVGTAQ
jgi:hypothetical protein